MSYQGIRQGSAFKKTVQTNLGHATAQFTLDTYGHATQKMRQDSANRMQHFYEQLSK